MNTSQELQCWNEYVHSKDVAVRNLLFDKYSSWAKWLAKELYFKVSIYDLELCEFEQYALEGLIQAIERYSLDKGVKFKSYAEYRIKGNILNNMPKLSECSARYNFNARFKEEVSDIEATTEDEPIEELVAIIGSLSIGYLLAESDKEVHSLQGTYYSSPEMDIIISKVMRIVSSLEEPIKSIISAYYYKDISMTMIADLLDLTKGRVSQLHKLGIDKIRKILFD